MRSAWHGLLVAATLAAATGVAQAQEGEPAVRPGAFKTGAIEAHKVGLAVLRMAQAALPLDAAAPALDGGIGTVVDGGAGLDSLPGIAPIHEAPAMVAPAPASARATEESAHATAEHGEAGDEHGEHAKFSTGTFVLQLFNFGILLFLLIYFGGRAMNKSLRARHEQLKVDLAEAARARDEAKQKFESQDRRLADLEKELATLRASMRKDAEREQARMMEGAQERARKIQEEMRFQLEQQVKEAEMLLRAEVASASVKLAQDLVQKSVDSLDQRRLAQEFAADFDGPATPAGGEG